MAEIPVLETERLILRGHRADDFEGLHAVWCEPDVYRHISGKPSTRETSWSRLLRYCGHWPLTGFGFWAVTDKASGHYIGEAGVADFRRDIEPSLSDTPEMGWVLSPAWHHLGLASEALQAVTAWCDAHLGRATCCIIAPDNAASIRLAEKIGFRAAHRATYMGDQVTIYMRPRAA